MDVPKQIGKYEIISKIATGGFGVIYKGWDPFIKRPVAVKMCAVPDEEVRQRFHREAQFVGNLVHRNITLVFDFGIEWDVPYIVQEFLTGYDLDEMLGYIAAAANHCKSKKLERELDGLYGRVKDVMESYDDGGWQN